MRRFKSVLAPAIVVALVASAPAAAQTLSPTVQGYSNHAPAATIQTTPTQTPAATIVSSTPTKAQPVQQAAAKSTNGSLPFTGLELGLVVGLGVALLGTGLVVRRISRPSASS